MTGTDTLEREVVYDRYYDAELICLPVSPEATLRVLEQRQDSWGAAWGRRVLG